MQAVTQRYRHPGRGRPAPLPRSGWVFWGGLAPKRVWMLRGCGMRSGAGGAHVQGRGPKRSCLGLGLAGEPRAALPC